MENKKKTILIVDDNLKNINLAANILIANNFNIAVAQNGEQALLFVKMKKPDLILLDIMMPGMSGIDICKILKKQPESKHIPIIFLTADNSKEKIVYALQIGGADYITKPFNQAELMARVSIHVAFNDSQLELKKTHNKIKSILDNTPDIIILYNKKGNIIDFNKTASKRLKISEKKLLNLNIKNIANATEFKDLESISTQIYKQKKSIFETTLKFPEDEIIDVEVATNLLLENGQTTFISVFRDITEQNKNSQSLKNSEKKYKQLTEATQDVVLSISLKGKLLYVSPSVTLFGGYDAHKETGSMISKYFAKKEELLFAIFNLKRVISENKGGLFEFLFKAKNKPNFYVELSYTPLYNKGKITEIEIVMRNISKRKAAEYELKESQANLLSIINSIPDFIFTKDKNSIYKICNTSFANFLGITPNVILNKSDVVLYNQEIASMFINSDKEVLQTGKDVYFSEWVTKENGEKAYIETRKSIIKSPDGETFGIVGVARDITTQKKTQDTLKAKNNELLEAYKNIDQGRKKYLTIFENSKDAIFIINNEKTINCNLAVVKMFQFKTTNDALNIHPAKFSPKIQYGKTKSIELYNKKIVQCMKNGTTQFEWIHTKQNGTTFPAEIWLTAVPYGEKRIIHAVVKDVSEQKQNETELENYRTKLENLVIERTQQLSLSEENFKALFNKNNDAIVINTLKGDIIKVNIAATKMLEYSAQELLTMNTSDFTMPQYNPNNINYFKRIKNGEKVIYQTKNKTKNGKIVPVEVSSTLIDYYGQSVILSVGRDITKRIENEKQKLSIIINTEEKERRRFAKDLHDGMGATLSAANMYLNTVKRSIDVPENISGKLNSAILLISKASKIAKEIAVNIQPHDLKHFGLGASLKNFCTKLNAIGTIRVQLKVNNFDVRLEDDIELNLFRIINELINNTLKYAEAADIFLTIRYTKQHILLSYADNGIGFDYKTIINSDTGTGLNNIVNRMKLLGGEINIYSKLWQGMKVEISLNVAGKLKI